MTSSAAPETSGITLPAVYRPTLTRVVLLGIGFALLAALTMMSFLLDSFSGGDRATFIGTGLLGLGVLALLSRPKVVAAPEGVTVVNLTTVRRLAWAEIVRVNLRPGDSWVHLDLADGTSLPAMGIQTGMAREQAIAQARALSALVAERGTGRSTT
ncbi:PH domain-containing protein [Streptomyces sp. I05A-00742]|uniref:PH domain-containing protein n=1 Tax=Streptomyces sp. I05A-00742 TaxID=2732853 RepID=UPI0014891431|nr:PH domain-containing protein [Streptomyces sp. I05A-00742]